MPDGRQAILDAAAHCFMEQGYHATSIDDVARRLRATKGRVYHYYPAKIDLFFDVHREGMRRLFDAVEPAMAGSGDGLNTLHAMLRAHANAMLEHHVYESAVVQGVQMHRFGATTPGQRRELDDLIAERDRFEGLFKAQVERAKADGTLAELDTSVTVKTLLGALQWSVVWYRPERTDDAAARAGSSGVAAAKALIEAGLSFDCFEKGSNLGGMWRYGNDNGLSSAYENLHIDTSRDNLGYSDFPIPKDRPDFLSHAEFLAHLEAYADRFGVRERVTFSTTVASVLPEPDGRWAVTLEGGGRRTYRAVIVANGHLWDPQLPAFPGRFDGEAIHSHHYRTAAPYEGKRVLVVGLGNSAVDIAVDLSRRSRGVVLSTRRGAWLMPKYLMGVPIDRWSAFLSRRLGLSTRLTRMVMAHLIRLAVGDQRRFGLPRPAHPMWREHATLSQDLLPAIGHGRVRVRPDVRLLDGDHVEFADGAREPFDAVIYVTGYRASFPFLDPEVFAVRDGEPVRLYRRIAALDRPGLYFVGLVQPVGPTIPLVEVQARWLAALLAGRLRPAEGDAMEAEVAAHRRALARTYVGSARYALEVDYRTYAGQLDGAIRARRA